MLMNPRPKTRARTKPLFGGHQTWSVNSHVLPDHPPPRLLSAPLLHPCLPPEFWRSPARLWPATGTVNPATSECGRRALQPPVPRTAPTLCPRPETVYSARHCRGDGSVRAAAATVTVSRCSTFRSRSTVRRRTSPPHTGPWHQCISTAQFRPAQASRKDHQRGPLRFTEGRAVNLIHSVTPSARSFG